MILATEDEDLNKKLNFAVFPEFQGGPLILAIAVKAVGFKETECIHLTNWTCDVLIVALETVTSDTVETEVQAKVVALCATLPVYK